MQKWSQRNSPKNQSKEESQFAKTFWRSKITFWAVSSQLMKHGSINTTLKRSGKGHSGRLTIPHDQKSSASPNQESKQYCFNGIREIVYYEFVLTGQRVNHVYYLEVLERLREKVRRKQPEILRTTHASRITTMHLLTRYCL